MPSISIPGSERAAEPVAEHDVRGFDFGGLARPFRRSRGPGPAQRPQPCIFSTLFLRNRNSMPLACLLTTISLRASAAAQLSEKSFTSMPNSLDILQRVVNFRGVQQNLRGDASDVQAGAAQKAVFFDDERLQSPLRGANRGVISPRTAADNREIVFGQVSSAAGRSAAQNSRVQTGPPL